MYISITNQCTRRCSYCFQKGWYLKDKLNVGGDEMPTDQVLEILSQIWKYDNNRKCSLLGGEPLLHSEILEILDRIKRLGKRVNIITNLCVDTNIIEEIFNKQLDKAIDCQYLNTDYTTNQQKLFFDNYKILLINNCSIYNGSTVTTDDADNIAKRFKLIRELQYTYKDTYDGLIYRIDTAAPNYIQPQKVIDYSKTIKTLIQQVQIDPQIVFRFDCCFDWCELSADTINQLKTRDGVVATQYGQCSPSADFATADISIDGDVYYCQAAPNINAGKYSDYKDLRHLEDGIRAAQEAYQNNHNLQCNYKSCNNFSPSKCCGPCIAKNKYFTNNSGVIPLHVI